MLRQVMGLCLSGGVVPLSLGIMTVRTRTSQGGISEQGSSIKPPSTAPIALVSSSARTHRSYLDLVPSSSSPSHQPAPMLFHS